MVSSCLNRTLISDAVAGTGANVSLLIQALTPLCPQPPPLVEIAADNGITVVVGYICGFLPWTVITLFDFISAKWKSVRKTRQLGYVHLVACVVPMIFVIAYAVLQALAGDYKEMMTAVIAVLLTFYHAARTLWGLKQLREYANWCRHTLQCIKATKPRYWVDLLNLEYKYRDEDEDEDAEDWDAKFMVNEDIVDNEFTGRDVSVSYSLADRSLVVNNPEVCTVRWAAAFLCSHGHHWESNDSESPLNPGIPFLTEILFLVGETESDMRPFSFAHLSLELSDEGNCSGAYGSKMGGYYLGDGVVPYESFKFEFENIVSSFPSLNDPGSENNRSIAHLELVALILAAKTLGADRLSDLVSHCRKRRRAFASEYQFFDALELLENQLKREIQWDSMHCLWKMTMVPHLSAKSNAFFLQVSAEQDNDTCLWLRDELKHVNTEISQNEHMDLFDRYTSLFASYSLGARYMLGVSLDVVRSLLAEWIISRCDSIDPALWQPDVPKDSISFVLSNYSLTQIPWGDLKCVLQECQLACLRNVMESAQDRAILPTSTAMICLFLLSYPAISYPRVLRESITAEEPKETVEKEIKLHLVPQNLWLSLVVDTETGIASLRIQADVTDLKFEWEQWINSAMAILKSNNQAVKNQDESDEDEFCGPLESIRKVDLSRPMLTVSHDEDDEILSQLPGQLQVWTGWPIFDVRFCQFDLGQWMDACGALAKDDLKEMDSRGFIEEQYEYERRKNLAMETLIAITEWNRA